MLPLFGAAQVCFGTGRRRGKGELGSKTCGGVVPSLQFMILRDGTKFMILRDGTIQQGIVARARGGFGGAVVPCLQFSVRRHYNRASSHEQEAGLAAK